MDGQSLAFHHEKGAISKDNQRLVNQYKLGQIFPDIFPRIILPKKKDLDQLKPERNFPVEKVEGIQLFDLHHQTDDVVLMVKIGIVALEQIQEVFEKTGIIICDRNRRNILVHFAEDRSYSIIQVDLEEVYDVVSDQDFIDSETNLSTRTDIQIKNWDKFISNARWEASRIVSMLLITMNNLNRKLSVKELDVVLYLEKLRDKLTLLQADNQYYTDQIFSDVLMDLKKIEKYLEDPITEPLVTL